MNQKRKIQIIGILLVALGLMLFVSLVGHRAGDDLKIKSDEAVYGNPFAIAYSNPGGMMGAYLSYICLFFLGWTAFFGALFVCVLGLKLAGLDIGRRLLKHAGMSWALVFLILMLIDIPRATSGFYSADVPGGAGDLGNMIIGLMHKLVGTFGAYIILIAAIISALVFYASISHRFHNVVIRIRELALDLWKDIAERLKPLILDVWENVSRRSRAVVRKTDFHKELDRASRKIRKRKRETTSDNEDGEGEIEDTIVTEDGADVDEDGRKRKTKRKVVLSGKSEEVSEGTASDGGSAEGDANTFIRPGVDLLSSPPQTAPAYSDKELAETARSLRETLETFGVRLDGNIEMYPGPVITRFEVRPAAGIKVNQIANLSEDLALNLRAKSIRIVAPIPGKAAVGIEIPNRNPQMVFIKDIISSEQYRQNSYYLPLAFGKDISGKPYVTDLAVMPHLLIAGTTGSGKSVCINVIITSLIYRLHPKELKFIFIDPKMLELTVYKGIPYLGEKVVTNPKQAERVLNDVVSEMENRYKKLAAAAVRSIVDYNKKQKSVEDRLPYIVIVIDELADLMMSTHSSRVELLITRLAQMARAVGIHLILATQRPSVDVITGLIKANFPSRVAFQVATKTDSRTILDGNGAERLLGAGDMLFLKAGSAEPIRLHGAYVSSEETEGIVSFMKAQAYCRHWQEETEAAAEEKAQMQQLNDPVLQEAIETVIRQGQASVSLLQRKLGIGYQRAARLIDELEAMSVIGPYNESKARDVLADKSFLENLKSGKIPKT
jgi:S-DNA-T family DNA segregation ATPase FtsK/SpoIIIE